MWTHLGKGEGEWDWIVDVEVWGKWGHESGREEQGVEIHN
jgi:hypothetical protein